MRRPITCLLASALNSVLLACGDDSAHDEPSQCAQLEQALCTRTTECAELTQLSTPARHDDFLKQCLRALESDLTCREPAPEIGADFELCQASIEAMPCDVIADALQRDEVIAPQSCSDFFAL